MSALPKLRSDITIQIEEAEDNRILIPITDNEAACQLLCDLSKRQKKFI